MKKAIKKLTIKAIEHTKAVKGGKGGTGTGFQGTDCHGECTLHMP